MTRTWAQPVKGWGFQFSSGLTKAELLVVYPPSYLDAPSSNFSSTDITEFRGGIIGQDIDVTNVIPEPSTWLMFGTGLAGLLGYGWRRKKQAAAV
ncbi:MAG: PEP-CTERM sorting domain-containing protein [Candidatus Tectimicrobiota bacterium]